MRRSLPIGMLVLGWMAAAGCHLANFRGPVPAALATSRQLSQQGLASLERGQPQEAETYLSKAVNTCPKDPDARRYYAETLWLKDSRLEAIGQLEEVCQLTPEDAASRVRLAEMYLAVGRVELARTSAEQALELSPKLPAAWAIRGRVMRAAGDLQQALADDQRALGYAPDDRQILLEVADLYHQMRQPERALATLQSLAETYSPGEEPQHVLYLLGLSYVALGRHEDGVESFSAAAVRGQPTPDILYRLAETQWLAGRIGDAAVSLQQALALEPRHSPSQELLKRIEVTRQAQSGIMR